MDARLVLARTPPIAQATAPAMAFEVVDDDFAAHLPQDEPVQSRQAPSRVEEARAEDAGVDDEVDGESIESEDSGASLATPFAPVLIRPPNSVVTFDLSALLAQTAATAATASVTPDAIATDAIATGVSAHPATAATQQQPPIGTPSGVIDPAALATGGPGPWASANSAPPSAEQQPHGKAGQAAADTAALTALESIAAAATAQGKTEARPLKTLRAGGRDGAPEGGPEFKAPASHPAAAQPVNGAAKVQTAMAVQPITPAMPSPEAPPATDSAPQILGAAPAEVRAHRLNETTGAMGHRPTTPATLVAQHIIRRFDGRSTSIDVRLDPAELGRVQVTLDVDRDNRVTAVVSAENPATLADLVRSSRELERALQDAGLNLESGDLTFDLAQRGDRDAPEQGAGPSRADADAVPQAPEAPTRAPRPFGLETWRGARVDVMV